MRKKGDALSTAWETINAPLVAADTAMKSTATQAQKDRKSLYLAVKRNTREREARRLASSMSVKTSNSKENAMSRIRGQSDPHTSGSIAREKQATHRHISSLMDDLPKSGPSKGVTVTKKTVSVEPLTKVTKVKKPVTICDLKKKAGINLARKYREKKAAEKKDSVKLAYDVVQAWGRVKLASSPDQQKAEAKRAMLKIAADPNTSPREKLAAAGLIGRGIAAGAKYLPKARQWMGSVGKGISQGMKNWSQTAKGTAPMNPPLPKVRPPVAPKIQPPQSRVLPAPPVSSPIKSPLKPSVGGNRPRGPLAPSMRLNETRAAFNARAKRVSQGLEEGLDVKLDFPKFRFPSVPKPQVPSVPKPQVSSVPKPQVPSVPKPQVSSVSQPVAPKKFSKEWVAAKTKQDQQYADQFWATQAPKTPKGKQGLEQVMSKIIGEAVTKHGGKLSMLTGPGAKRKMSAYRLMAQKMGYRVGEFKFNAQSGTAQAKILPPLAK